MPGEDEKPSTARPVTATHDELKKTSSPLSASRAAAAAGRPAGSGSAGGGGGGVAGTGRGPGGVAGSVGAEAEVKKTSPSTSSAGGGGTGRAAAADSGGGDGGSTGVDLSSTGRDQVSRPDCCYCQGPTPPVKSWNCVCKISRTWRVLGNEFGAGNLSARSWNLLGNDADTMTQMQTPEYAHPHAFIVVNNCKKVFEQFLCCFFATCDSDEHILQNRNIYVAVCPLTEPVCTSKSLPDQPRPLCILSSLQQLTCRCDKCQTMSLDVAHCQQDQAGRCHILSTAAHPPSRTVGCSDLRTTQGCS